MSRDFHLPGRSPVIACDAMAATSHPLATLTAIETLRAGGNAADAAVTAVAVLCVVEPQMTGIGGDCFCMLQASGHPVWGYNGSGRAGARASLEALMVPGVSAIAGDSIHAVTVPGAIDAWAAILDAPVAARGSFLTAEDFARHRGEAVAPISTNYRGLDVLELPPNTQGLTALVLLNILERFDLAALDPLGPDRFHLALEAARFAYAVRDTHVADPAFMRAAVPALLDKGFAAELAGRIGRARRMPHASAAALGSDTVY